MEVVVPVPEFHFPTARTTPASPQKSAPSSPPNYIAKKPSPSFFDFRHHRHLSAPNSPTSSAAIYAALRESAAATRGTRQSSIPFDWEEKPGTPKSHCEDEKDDDFDFDFAFGFSGRHQEPLPTLPEAAITAADDLFEFGKIRPLKPPPRLYSPVMGEQAPKSPRTGGLWSPLRRGRNQRSKEEDPFAVAMMEATRSRRGSRSLSPFRNRGKVGGFLTPASSPPRNPPPMAEKGGRGWKCRLKELLLFRSSSEGRAIGQVKKNALCKNGSSSSSSSSSSASSMGSTKGKRGSHDGGGEEESRSSGFRLGESGLTLRGVAAAAHEDEYAENRAVEIKKKMVVPYKQSIFSIRSFTAGKLGVSFNRRLS